MSSPAPPTLPPDHDPHVAPAAKAVSVTRVLPDENATAALGLALARGVAQVACKDGRGLNVHVSGELGAGKTTLIRAMLRALGVQGRVKSPTYALMEPYELWLSGTPAVNGADSGLELMQNLSLYCYHFDFYRFTHPREVIDAGFRELFDEGALCLVEWPERVFEAHGGRSPLMAPPDLQIFVEPAHDISSAGTLSAAPDADPATGRIARLVALSERGRQCLSAAGF